MYTFNKAKFKEEFIIVRVNQYQFVKSHETRTHLFKSSPITYVNTSLSKNEHYSSLDNKILTI